MSNDLKLLYLTIRNVNDTNGDFNFVFITPKYEAQAWVADLPVVAVDQKLKFRGPFPIRGAPDCIDDQYSSPPVLNPDARGLIWSINGSEHNNMGRFGRQVGAMIGMADYMVMWHIGPHLEYEREEVVSALWRQGCRSYVVVDNNVITLCTQYLWGDIKTIRMVQRFKDEKDWTDVTPYHMKWPEEDWLQNILFKDERDSSIEYVYSIKSKASQPQQIFLDVMRLSSFNNLRNTESKWQPYKINVGFDVGLSRNSEDHTTQLITHAPGLSKHRLYFFALNFGSSEDQTGIKFSYVDLRKDGSLNARGSTIDAAGPWIVPIGITEGRDKYLKAIDISNDQMLLAWLDHKGHYCRVIKIAEDGTVPDEGWERAHPDIPSSVPGTFSPMVVGSHIVEGLE